MQDDGALRIARTSTAGASAHWRSNASNRLPCATQRKPRSANQRRKASRSTAARSGQAPQSRATLLRQVLGAAQNIKTGGKLDLFLPHQRALPPGGRGVARRLKRMTMGPLDPPDEWSLCAQAAGLHAFRGEPRDQPCRRTAGRGGRAPANVATCPDKTYTHDGWLGWEHCLYHAILDAAPAPAPKRARVHEEGCFE